MTSPPTSFWSLERDDFGRVSVVRHRHPDRFVTGYIGTDTDGREYARCAECGAQELLEVIEAPTDAD